MSWKKKIGLGFAALFALIFLFLVVEHFRGKWGLARWKARMAAKGEPLTIPAVTVPLPADNENGMPALALAASQAFYFPQRLRPHVGLYAAQDAVVVMTDLAEWPASGRSTNITWEVIEEAVQKREGALSAAVKALQSTKFNRRLDYYAGWGLRMPHLSYLAHLSSWLGVAALARFRDGDFDKGTEYLEALIRLPGALEDESVVISQLIRMNIAHTAFQFTWQAVNAGGLRDESLKRLQDAWAEQDFLRALRRVLSMEHVMASHEFARVRDADASLDEWINMGSQAPSPPIASPIDLMVTVIEQTPEFFRQGVYIPIWKFAWSHQDELNCLKTVERALNAWDSAMTQQSAIPVKNFGRWDYREIYEDPPVRQHLYDRLRYVVSPRADGFYPSMKRAFCAQTLRELARTGVALERYRLRFGRLPTDLSALVPEFLPAVPHDFMDGQALRYRPPVLYSVGLDAKDNAADAEISAVRDFNILGGRDFVWPRRATPEEVKARFDSWWH